MARAPWFGIGAHLVATIALAACSSVVVDNGSGGSGHSTNTTGTTTGTTTWTTTGTGGGGATTTTTWTTTGTGGSGAGTTWSSGGTGGVGAGTTSSTGGTTTTWTTTTTTWTTTSGNWCDGSGDCNSCTSCAWYGPCSGYADACVSNPACNAILNCYPSCAPNDAACLDACWDDHPAGHVDYNRVAICIYCDNCYSDCDGASLGCP